MHSLATIEQMKAQPITKATIPAQGRDAVLAGNMLAAEAVATAMTQSNVWHGFAVRVINLTADGRDAFLAAVRGSLKDFAQRNAEAIADTTRTGEKAITDADRKAARKRLATATVYLSGLSIIAKAWNKGATTEGLIAYFKQATRERHTTPALDAIGYTIIVEYARTFSDSKAGRRADDFKTKLTKFIERNPPADDDTIGVALLAQVMALLNQE